MVAPNKDASDSSLPARSPQGDEHGYYSEADLESIEYLDMPLPQKGRLHEMILEDPISQLNAPKPIILEASDPVSKAVKLMKKFRYGSVLVQEDEWLVGIFTEKDLLHKTGGLNFDLDQVTLREWMPILPWPVWPLAGHARLGQNVVVGSMRVLRVALGNVPGGVWLDPRFHCK
jgi:hypothetical protein